MLSIISTHLSPLFPRLKAMRLPKKTLAEQTADRLIDTIIAGEIQKGAQLPNEFQLAERLDVGRGTIREAIKILASKHIVEIRRGHGTYISEQPGRVEDPLGLTFLNDKKKLASDLYELRLLIEPQIAALAAERASAEDLNTIQSACLAVEANITAQCPWTDEDIALHEAIANASGNQVVSNIIPIIHSAVKVFAELYGKPLTETTVESHRALVAAITDGDAVRAQEAMISHLQRNKQYLETFIDSPAPSVSNTGEPS